MAIHMRLLYFRGRKPRKVIEVIRKWEIIEKYDMEELHNFAKQKYEHNDGNIEDLNYINVWLSKEDILFFKDGLHRFDEEKRRKYEEICDGILGKIEEGYMCVYGSEKVGPWG